MESMINYNRTNLNIISLLITIIIFSLIIFILNLINSQNSDKKNMAYINKIGANIEENNIVLQDISLEEIIEWKVIIEELNLEAEIKEGTSEEQIKGNVGHYTSSNYLYGNVSLKAHNIGENKNYFANLKDLEIGDEIKYIVNGKENVYKVISNQIINNEEEYACKKYEKDTITLITYVKDLEGKMRCVIGEKIWKMENIRWHIDTSNI